MKNYSVKIDLTDMSAMMLQNLALSNVILTKIISIESKLFEVSVDKLNENIDEEVSQAFEHYKAEAIKKQDERKKST